MVETEEARLTHLFIFNGKSSRDFMVNISGQDTWRKPAPIMETVSVPGRNGQIMTFTGAYENAEVTYHCGIAREFDSKYTAFINWLLANPGYRRLEDSYHPDVFRLATVSALGDPSLTRLNRSGEFDISFTCKPQSFLRAGEKKAVFTANGELYNPTLYSAKPLIRIYGTGTLTIGGESVTITAANEYTDLDCELEDAYKDSSLNNCNGNIRLYGDHFPVIPAGKQGVQLGSGITRVEITPRWWQL